MFGIMEESRTMENLIGSMIKRLGLHRKYLIVSLATFVYGFLGMTVGYENNIATIPLAAVLSLALGGDLILAAGISIGAMTVGFGLSPVNPYTVGTGHQIAQLPLFSGGLLRSALCFLGLCVVVYFNLRYLRTITKNPHKSLGRGLDEQGIKLSSPVDSYRLSPQNKGVLAIFLSGLGVILYGVFEHHWYMNELSAVFLMMALLSGICSKMGANDLSQKVLVSVSKAAPGAFMVGFATAIKILMETAHMTDSICFYLSETLSGLPPHISAVGMAFSQGVVNFFIPSGSGQALATLPVMLPLGNLLGLTPQITILAFQIGDGISNLINPTLGGLIAMLSMCRVPLDRWIRFILPTTLGVLVLCGAFLILAVAIDYS